ncbi:hypothetical protein [Nannocystis pusilla]|uniref:hypothetical protein n=1 Tax=Nannocystis pusilla TaxID=889268 RepID=UPI003B827275
MNKPNIAKSTATPGATPGSTVPGSCCKGCASGGSCEDGCPNPIMNQLPGCYGNCRVMSECLQQYMRVARALVDDASWMEYQKGESPIVHINQSIGAAPNYQAAFPLGTNQNMLLMQEAAQVLPYEPGLLKVDAEWSGTPAPSEVTVNIYAGNDSVTSVSSTPSAAGLVQIGRSMNLADFECGDDCYLVGFPDAFGCDVSAIPFRRRVFVELRGGAMGASTLTGLNFTIIKKSTKKFSSLCKQFNLVV